MSELCIHFCNLQCIEINVIYVFIYFSVNLLICLTELLLSQRELNLTAIVQHITIQENKKGFQWKYIETRLLLTLIPTGWWGGSIRTNEFFWMALSSTLNVCYVYLCEKKILNVKIWNSSQRNVDPKNKWIIMEPQVKSYCYLTVPQAYAFMCTERLTRYALRALSSGNNLIWM